jgi:hypothetical protein
METPYLDKMIDDLQNHIEHAEAISYAGIPETRKELAEYEAIKRALSLHNVSGSFTADQMSQAYIDGYNEGFPEPCFDINNYR